MAHLISKNWLFALMLMVAWSLVPITRAVAAEPPPSSAFDDAFDDDVWEDWGANIRKKKEAEGGGSFDSGANTADFAGGQEIAGGSGPSTFGSSELSEGKFRFRMVRDGEERSRGERRPPKVVR